MKKTVLPFPDPSSSNKVSRCNDYEDISKSERLVLVSLRGSKWGKTLSNLVYSTGLSSSVLKKSIRKLTQLGFAAVDDVEGVAHYYAVELSAKPIAPLCPKWTTLFREMRNLVEPGDTEGYVFASCGIVLLVAILNGSREHSRIAQIADLPEPFVLLVVGLAERAGLWASDNALLLQRTILETDLEVATTLMSLHALAEQFWNSVWTPSLGATMGRLHDPEDRRE